MMVSLFNPRHCFCILLTKHYQLDTMILEIRVPRDNEYTPESAIALFSGFTHTLSRASLLNKILRRPTKGLSISLEIACYNQQIRFYAVFEDEIASFFESQLLAAYPLAIMIKAKNYLENFAGNVFSAIQLVQSNSYYYPIKAYKEFTDIDPISNFLAVMSKAGLQDYFIIQMILSRAPKNWQGAAQRAVETGIPIDKEGGKRALPGEALIKQKIAEAGLKAGIRLVANNNDKLHELAGSFAAYTRGDGNSLVIKRPTVFSKKAFCQSIVDRSMKFTPGRHIFSVSELASLWHLPGVTVKIPNIAWSRSILFEAPENLPAALNVSEEEKQDICFFARTEFRNRDVIFGIKKKDRRRHIYIIGKTGTGKTTLISNMVIDDLKKGRGVGVIDPHGDLCEEILDYIPARRINDVCYFNPADRENPISINILQSIGKIDAELVTSGIVAIFQKLYGYSWGPRLEHILRNVVMTLANVDGTTLVDVLRMMTEKKFRDNILTKINDQVLISFWREEFEKMPDRLQKEAISPIQNKVGQFVTSPLVRSIIGHPQSSLTLESVMDEGKIFLANLSQGRLGEDNAALLGAMLITKVQQAAMHRVDVPEEQRRDFYLYVDEFQNFATVSFIKILSEARKYRLNLTLANQYMAQIDPEIQRAIFGNIGSMITFVVGADDASILEKEFGQSFLQKDLVSLDRHQVALKLTIDNQMSLPFLAHTLPPAASKNQNREKVIRVSRERYAYKKEPLPPIQSVPVTNLTQEPVQPAQGTRAIPPNAKPKNRPGQHFPVNRKGNHPTGGKQPARPR